MTTTAAPTPAQKTSVSYREALTQAMREEMQRDPSVFVMGEDVGQYEGAFKVTRGLSERYPDRVLSTPISEAGITGVATGLALCGDTGAAVRAVAGREGTGGVLVLGTGGFLVVGTGAERVDVPGLLTTLLWEDARGPRYAIEGTVHGAVIAAAAMSFATCSTVSVRMVS